MPVEEPKNWTQEILDLFTTIVMFMFQLIIGIIKAILPCGILPRKSVKGEIVLITGAGHGLGQLMAVEFAKLGAIVVLWDMNENSNNETKKMILDMGAQAYAYTVDVSKKSNIYESAKKIVAEVGHVTILVNNAGIVSGKKFMECPDEKIEATVAVNMMAHFWTVKAFAPHMVENNHGHIVTIASIAGKIWVSGLSDYCASKFGTVGFSSALDTEFKQSGLSGIHVTTICPFCVDTGMFKGFRATSPYLLPILKPDYVTDRIMEAVLTNQNVVYMPRFCYFAMFLQSFLPATCTEIICNYFGINESMGNFIGHSASN